MILRSAIQCVKESALKNKQISCRFFAVAPGKAGGKGKGGAARVEEEVVDLSKYVPVNIYKDGTHPEIKNDSEYPKWLFTLLDEDYSYGELKTRGVESLTDAQKSRLKGLKRRHVIKLNNASTSKKG